MRTLIISGGNISTDFALSLYKEEHFDCLIAVDNGLKFLYEHQLVPTHIVGDFDTAKPGLVDYYRKQPGIEIRTFDPVKDATDTQIAIERALEIGSTEIVILGGTGTRLDHVLGNIQSVALALDAGVKCELLDEHNRISLLKENRRLLKAEQYGDYISLIPLTSVVEGVDLKGFKYPLKNHTFTSTGSAGLGVSNEIIAEEAEVCLRSGVFILIESRD